MSSGQLEPLLFEAQNKTTLLAPLSCLIELKTRGSSKWTQPRCLLLYVHCQEL